MTLEVAGLNRVDRELALLGVRSDVAGWLLPDGVGTRCKNMVCENGVAAQRPGLSMIDSLPEAPLYMHFWETTAGERKLIAATKTRIFEFDVNEGAWKKEPRNLQLEVESCDAAWTAGRGVSASANGSDKKWGSASAKFEIGSDFYEEICECEEAWDPEEGCSCAADTEIKYGGNASNRIDVSEGFGTGLMASDAIGPVDLSDRNKVVFYIRSSIDVESGQLQLILSESERCETEDVVLDIPALVAGVWTSVSLDADLSDMDATISVGLKATASLGACSIWIDRINALDDGWIGYKNFSTKDLSAYGGVGFWIKCSIDVEGVWLKLVLSESSDVGSEDVVVNVPALAAEEWTYVYVSKDLSSMDATLSVGLKSLQSLPVGCVLHVDDVRVFEELSGDEDDRFWGAVLGNVFVLTNGKDYVLKWDGESRAFERLGHAGYNSGDYHKAAVLLQDRGHIVFVGCQQESSGVWTPFPRRIRWCAAGNLNDWDSTYYLDVPGGSAFVAAAAWNGRLVLLSRDDLCVVNYVGGSAVYASPMSPVVAGDVCWAPSSVCSHATGVYFVGLHNIYRFSGKGVLEPIGNAVKDLFLAEVDRGRLKRAVAVIDEQNHKYIVCVPSQGSDYPDSLWIYDILKGQWTMGKLEAASFVRYRGLSGITIGDLGETPIGELAGTIGQWRTSESEEVLLVGRPSGAVGAMSTAAANDISTAIESEWCTRDFSGGIEAPKRWQKAVFEAAGHRVFVSYSKDGGQSWSGETEIALSSEWAQRTFWFDCVSPMVRLRFRNPYAGEWFALRRIAVYYKPMKGAYVE